MDCRVKPGNDDESMIMKVGLSFGSGFSWATAVSSFFAQRMRSAKGR